MANVGHIKITKERGLLKKMREKEELKALCIYGDE